MKSVKLRSPASCCSAPASASWRSALAVVARASDLGSTSQFRLRVELAENFRLGPQLGAHARRLLERSGHIFGGATSMSAPQVVHALSVKQRDTALSAAQCGHF